MREDYEEFEVDTQLDDNNNQPCVSSYVGSCGDDEQLDLDEDGPGQSDVRGWRTMNEAEINTTIVESLKHLGNVQKRPMSPLILKDGVGKAVIKQMKDVKKNHKKIVRRDILRVNSIIRAWLYFHAKMKVRRARLDNNIEQVKSDLYPKRQYSWRNVYTKKMAQQRKVWHGE